MTPVTLPQDPTTEVRRSRLLVIGLLMGLMAVLAYLALNGGDSSSPVATDTPVVPAQSGPATEESVFLTEEELLDQIASEYAEGRTVMNGPDGEPVGYILRSDFDTVEESAGIGVDRGFNIYDVESDEHIGYWYSGVGFVSLEDYGSGVDAADLAGERYGDDYAELYRDNFRAIELVSLGDDRTPSETEELEAILAKHDLNLP